MTVGISISMALLLISLSFGLMGLYTNGEQFEDYSQVAEEKNLATKIDAELRTSRMVFRQFLAQSDDSYLYAFEDAQKSMQGLVEAYKKTATDPTALEQVGMIEEKLNACGQSFQKIRNLDAEMSTYYTSTAAAGFDVLDALDDLEDLTYSRGEIVESKAVAKAV